MLKFLLAAAPYLLKVPSQNTEKQIARSFTALVLFALSGFAFLAATFIFITSLYGAALAFLCVSGLLLVGGIALYLKAKKRHHYPSDAVITTETNDPIAALLPEAVMKDPAVKKLMNQITANPVATSVAAAAIGMIITREFMKD